MKKLILKSFLGKIILLVLPIIILYAVLYYTGYRPVLSDSVSFDAKIYKLNSINIKHTDVMVLGSSIALNDLNTKVFKDSIPLSYYNFGAWQLQAEDDFIILKHYFPRCRPRYVIFTSTMHDYTDAPNATIPPALDLSGTLLGYYYIKNFSSLWEIIKRKNTLDEDTKDHNRYDCLLFDDGGGVELQLTKETLNNPRQKAELGEFPNKRYSPKAYQSLANIAKFLKDNGVKLIFIQTPYSKRFIKTPLQEDSVNAHFNKCKAIVEDAGGAYFNYHDFFKDAEAGAFVDPAHLSGEGSKLFTKRVVKDLKSIIR